MISFLPVTHQSHFFQAELGDEYAHVAKHGTNIACSAYWCAHSRVSEPLHWRKSNQTSEPGLFAILWTWENIFFSASLSFILTLQDLNFVKKRAYVFHRAFSKVTIQKDQLLKGDRTKRPTSSERRRVEFLRDFASSCKVLMLLGAFFQKEPFEVPVHETSAFIN